MTSSEIRTKFLEFFEKRGHIIRPSSSLVPEGDSSVLFTTAGMQQFKPYYLNPEMADNDLGGRNIVTVQKCVRTGDIDEVGDNTHLTFFEMLGNFSFGGYSRREAITYGHDFIIKELGLPISYVTFYKGSDNVPRDDESRMIWQELGVADIREDGNDVFWGPTGESGPCGPTTEIYCKNASGQDVEIWNIVFNEYFCDGSREKLDKGEATLKKLETLGIDTGMGLERLLTIVNQKESMYETDVFIPIIESIRQNSVHREERFERIIADHLRTSIFIVADGVVPSNKDRGYILRRLIRRAVMQAQKLGLPHYFLSAGVVVFGALYTSTYPELAEFKIDEILKDEEDKFRKTLEQGLKEFEKGTDPFILATTYGFPIELTEELAREKGIMIDREKFDADMGVHQAQSRSGAEQKFKGGLANTNEQTIKLHTAHHLLLAALQKVLGPTVKQKGSNITEERLRIDFNFDRKMTDDEKKDVEKLVNKWIDADYSVVMKEMTKDEAEKIGAEMEFGAKYGDKVSVYFIEDENGNPISKEFCGGPHVIHTGELGHFKILKEEASSAGIRRIKAILE